MSHGLLPSFGRPSSTPWPKLRAGPPFYPQIHQSSQVLLPTELRCSSINHSQESYGSVSPTSAPSPSRFKVKFQTLKGCKLGIGRFPDFEYDATGGSGTATGKADGPTDELTTRFETESLHIPPLTGATTRFLGFPLPPLLEIAIAPEVFEGTINTRSGKVELQFRARFLFSIGKLYKAPPLVVETNLTSEESVGSIRRGRGERLGREGRCSLVGVAAVEAIDDVFMNFFLSLPTECIANLNAKISIAEAE
ncbi:hypothetical protein HPP92_003105 [Vanilla planifolia]|uniref:Uncharacterized protein n=1 Tax=Vanilla planifolia TaxID=51239 RepID=A0A835VN46_VANPL|nr:hypothetical protein HPP92_003105 [Vanilla planifolia]